MVFNRTNDTSARARTHALIQFNCNTTSARTSAARRFARSLLSLHFAGTDNFPFTFPHRFQFGWQKPTRRRRRTKERPFDVRVIAHRHSLAGRHYTLHVCVRKRSGGLHSQVFNASADRYRSAERGNLMPWSGSLATSPQPPSARGPDRCSRTASATRVIYVLCARREIFSWQNGLSWSPDDRDRMKSPSDVARI